MTYPIPIPVELVIELAATPRGPGDDDLEEQLSHLTGQPFSVCGEAIYEAIANGYLEYSNTTETALDARPTPEGLRLLANRNR